MDPFQVIALRDVSTQNLNGLFLAHFKKIAVESLGIEVLSAVFHPVTVECEGM